MRVLRIAALFACLLGFCAAEAKAGWGWFHHHHHYGHHHGRVRYFLQETLPIIIGVPPAGNGNGQAPDGGGVVENPNAAEVQALAADSAAFAEHERLQTQSLIADLGTLDTIRATLKMPPRPEFAQPPGGAAPPPGTPVPGAPVIVDPVAPNP